MGRPEPIAWWLLPVCGGIGLAVALYTLTEHELTDETPRLLRVSLLIGGGIGALFWLVLRWLGFGGGGLSPVVLGDAVLRAAIWGVAAWPFTAWMLEREFRLPHDQSYELTTRICGVTLLLLFIAASAAVLIAYV